ncbi:hypothetical protein CCM_08701 [Cordyceps militaris CM01]|uniref:DUF7770 domain-containing protein n=1 Tax=Cordyceps militaris (strain CM01) TaxID=983644 RepID=G3JS10_CORMM|nr:uncharacterized protein CCM_08701 [Cordyceps militaris CM01]EGX88656.1 hypothetical protein CCM_08701 [Cordyceps militaris CM01]
MAIYAEIQTTNIVLSCVPSIELVIRMVWMWQPTAAGQSASVCANDFSFPVFRRHADGLAMSNALHEHTSPQTSPCSTSLQGTMASYRVAGEKITPDEIPDTATDCPQLANQSLVNDTPSKLAPSQAPPLEEKERSGLDLRLSCFQPSRRLEDLGAAAKTRARHRQTGQAMKDSIHPLTSVPSSLIRVPSCKLQPMPAMLRLLHVFGLIHRPAEQWGHIDNASAATGCLVYKCDLIPFLGRLTCVLTQATDHNRSAQGRGLPTTPALTAPKAELNCDCLYYAASSLRAWPLIGVIQLQLNSSRTNSSPSIQSLSSRAAAHGMSVQFQDTPHGKSPERQSRADRTHHKTRTYSVESQIFAPMATLPIDVANMDKHWNLSYFQEADAGVPIVAVHICAYSDLADAALPRLRRNSDHDPVFDSDEDHTASRFYQGTYQIPENVPNHWAVLLELRNGGGRGLNSKWRRRGRLGGHHAKARSSIVKSVRFGVVSVADTTVQQVFENVSHNARHRYLFTEGGEGSRYWVLTVLQDLETAEILGEADAEAAEDVLSMIWSRDKEAVAKRVRRGMFTDWTIRGDKKPSLWSL